jgi:hypothetical protein
LDASTGERRTKGNDELRVVRVFGAVVGHGDNAAVCKTQPGVDFILKGLYTAMKNMQVIF